ncbi:MAG: ArsR/SmtB family transcription factor [Actinomycetota bacterium]
MDSDADIAAIAAAIGNRARATILDRLMDGGALPAGMLAASARVSPSTASVHLETLTEAGLVEVEPRGRQRRYRLARPEVADAIEALAVIAPRRPVSTLRAATAADRLRAGRTCYDHLAGRLGVGVTDALLARGALRRRDRSFEVTRGGERVFGDLGIDLEAVGRRRRAFALACLDWTERREHLAGAIGAAVCDRLVELSWVDRRGPGRAVAATEDGVVGLIELGVDAATLDDHRLRR